MQALTGLFARQFGTPNYAAHGGFCSVNMAAGMIYTIGGSFWEFGGPDLERSKLFIMIGTAEDHHSNPMKIALAKFKREGGRFISINPVRTGYSAIADEWVPIRPGTDGALMLALIHEIIALGLYDREFLVRYTNSGQLVNLDDKHDEFGMFVRTEVAKEEGCYDPQNKLWWDRNTNKPVITHTEGADPFLLGEFKLSDGTAVKPAFQLLQERVKDYTPEWAEQITGIPAETITPPGARDGHHRARPEDRTADRLDRFLGQGARHRYRQSGLVPCHARSGRALQRFSHDTRAVDTDDAAGHHRPARRFPPQDAVPASDSALRAHAERPARGAAEHAAGRHGAGLAVRPGRPVRQCRRQSGAYRQGVLVGISAVGARHDAQRHHQCLARRSVQDRHAAAVHGQHGVELER